MKKYVLSVLCVLVAVAATAQTQFLLKGKIEYERKMNVHRQAEANMEEESFFKDFVSKLPKFYNSYFELSFTSGKTIYQPGKKESEGNPNMTWFTGPAKDNIIVTDLDNSKINSFKKVYEASYLVEDSIRKIEWKLGAETRTIAGFECRKAVGIICDSVYVVAFYTDEIAVSGGPESFNGLPGMILGLAIPRLYTTWFATKVELTEPADKDFVITKRAKKMTGNELQSTLQKSLKDWGKSANRNIWWVML
jgi:GLPGLI family protein